MARCKDKPSRLPLEMAQLVTCNNNKLDQFQFKPFVVNPSIIPDYAEWWRFVFNRAFAFPPEHYLSKLGGGSCSKPSQPPRPAISKATTHAGSKVAPQSKSLTIRGKHLNLAFN